MKKLKNLQNNMDKIGFRKELEKLINRCSMENGSDTPDFILSEYLIMCLIAFDKSVEAREKWYGRFPRQPIPADQCPCSEVPLTPTQDVV